MTIASWWRRALAAASLLVSAGLCLAEPLPGQSGLPPELVIEDTLSLEQQTAALQACIEWAGENQPRGGFIQGLKNMFSREKPPMQVNISDLAEQPGAFIGEEVSIHGLYEPLAEDQGQFRSVGGSLCRIVWLESVAPVGFPEGSPDGLPTEVHGSMESEGGVPVVRATAIQPSGMLAMIRLARIQELEAERFEELGRVIAARAGLQPGDIEVGLWRVSARYVVRVRALVTHDGDKIRAVAGKELGLEPDEVELVDLEASQETHSGILTAVDKYQEAAATYRQVGGRPVGGMLYSFVPFAGTHGALLELEELAERGGRKRGAKQLQMLWTSLTVRKRNGESLYYTWVQQPDGQWQRTSVREAIAKPLDEKNRESFWYKLVHLFVIAGGGNPALGMILLAVVSRIAIYPLTRKQLHSAEAMKRLQPQIKQLQEQHKGDKQKFQEEFWKLCKANNVNPLGGCMPLLIQMPILIMIYQGIRQYIVPFDKASFLWVANLAQPDIILLLAYTASMVLFQQMVTKTNPAAAMDPQQAQQQKMMTWMMPLMFFFFFRGLPAAFILYWLGTNVVYFGQQWWYLRQTQQADQQDGETVTEPTPSGLSGGFSGWMARLMSGQSEEPTQSEERKRPTSLTSFEEKKRAAAGKKVRKEDDEKNKSRRGRRR